MIFPMTLDRASRRATLVALILVGVASAVAGAILVYAATHTRSLAPAVIVALGGFAFLVVSVSLGLAWAMAPRAVELAGGELRVVRRAWPALRVPLASVESAARGENVASLRTLRVVACGDLFGSYGPSWSRALGRHRLYATSFGPAVLVRRHGALPLVLTPDDPERFLESLGAGRAPAA